MSSPPEDEQVDDPSPLSQLSAFTYELPDEEVVFDDESQASGMSATSQASVAPTAPTTQPSAPKYSPTKPIMGDILKTSEETPWTGGVPKPDWSGLVSTPLGPKTACQLRPESGKSAMYSYTERIKGLKEPSVTFLALTHSKERSVNIWCDMGWIR